jgi:hypothetical protein
MQPAAEGMNRKCDGAGLPHENSAPAGGVSTCAPASGAGLFAAAQQPILLLRVS